MRKKSRSKKNTEFFEKTDKAKIKYNRNKNGFQKHKIENYRSGGESG